MKRQTSKENSSELRHKVAREAATLLYFGQEKEYKQAKVKAAQNLCVHVLPSNLEIALELDQVAQETEGTQRAERLIQMRTDALKIMKMLTAFCPVLIGSVWRGNIRRGSDIDIEVFHDEPDEIVPLLKSANHKITKSERITVNEHGKTETSTHIHAETENNHTVEIVIRPSEFKGRKRTCDTFGDEIKGIKPQELEKLLKENPTQQFLPA